MSENHDHDHFDGEPLDTAAENPVRPEFDQANFVADSLARQNAEQAKRIAILEAEVAQRDAFIQANAQVLGLAENLPNRAARRAATKRAPRKNTAPKE